MPKSKEYKETLLKKYKDTLSEADGYIAVDPTEVDTATTTELKKELKENNADYIVVKNTIFKIALQDENEIPPQTIDFSGATAIITYSEDPTIPAKAVQKVQKQTKLFAARYGYIGKKYLDSQRVMDLADIPGREELLAKLVGSLSSPVSGFMNTVTGNLQGFARVISALKDQKEAEA
ncbi:50S ribosomal protein L10 [Candidatus Dojkabacteria bacterium]|nr:50S ribosomal protein L10 [Candidatus Dojkabacteria bacterium]